LIRDPFWVFLSHFFQTYQLPWPVAAAAIALCRPEMVCYILPLPILFP
jgi:hypothetical protein